MNPSVLDKSTEPMPDQQQVNGNLSSTGGIRLNLGGRGTVIAGFTTVDLSELNKDGIHSDISDLWMFETETVDEIYASHVLEHFSHTKTGDVLKEWFRVLKKGGKIWVAVPDFQRAIEIYQKYGLVPWVVNFLYGDQGYPLAYHYTGFTFATLAGQLADAGFRSIKRISTMPYGVRDCSGNVSNTDGKSVSLNVGAIK